VPDLSHTIGGDLSFSANGDLLTADSLPLSQQRVLRRLITNLNDYIWHPDYGAGLPGMVGQPINAATVKNIVQSQMFLEDTVVQNPPPVINVTPVSSGMFVEIQYTESDSQQTSILNFTVNA
jgi:hypothetical protein